MKLKVWGTGYNTPRWILGLFPPPLPSTLPPLPSAPKLGSLVLKCIGISEPQLPSSECLSHYGIAVGIKRDRQLSLLAFLVPGPELGRCHVCSDSWMNWWQSDCVSCYTWFGAQLLSCVLLFAIPWTTAHQVSLSMDFSRQDYWNGLSFPPPGDLSPISCVSWIGRQAFYHRATWDAGSTPFARLYWDFFLFHLSAVLDDYHNLFCFEMTSLNFWIQPNHSGGWDYNACWVYAPVCGGGEGVSGSRCGETGR